MKKEKRMRRKAIPAVMALTVAFSGGLTTLPSFVNAKASAATVNQALSKEEIVKAYLNSKVKSLARSGSGWEQFKIVGEEANSVTDTYHVRTIEQYKGIPIYGSGQTVALDANNNVYASFGDVTQTLSRAIIPTEASISEDDAVATAKESIDSQIGVVKNYDGIDTQLTIYPYKGKYYLAYLVKASTSVPAPGYFHYFVDATNGEIINSYNAIDNVDVSKLTVTTGKGLDVFGKMQTFPVGKDTSTGSSYLYGGSVTGSTTSPTIVPLATFDAHRMPETSFIILSALLGFTGFEVTTTSPTNFFYDPAAVSAHVNADKVNKYYQNVFKRNSLDNKGMTLISTVHVGAKWNNAAWNGKQMLYGDGDGVVLGALSGGLDVIGHEMTHGVIEKSGLDLTYSGESGALNESLADIFGTFVQIYTTKVNEWEMGEDVYTPTKPGDGGLRSLSDPGSVRVSTKYMPSGYYPDTYQDRYLGTEDNGGVHINSGINNKAAYLITQGGTNNGYTITGVGVNNAQKIYYQALKYLTADSNFKEMRAAVIQASRDFFPDKNGVPSAQTKAVMDAYTSVGVYE